MVYTNQSSISNSGSAYFVNKNSKISKLNLNIIDNSNALYNYAKSNSNQSTNTNSNINPIIDANDFKLILFEQRAISKLSKFCSHY